MLCAPYAIDFMPDAHTLLIVVHTVVSGMPGRRACIAWAASRVHRGHVALQRYNAVLTCKHGRLPRGRLAHARGHDVAHDHLVDLVGSDACKGSMQRREGVDGGAVARPVARMKQPRAHQPSAARP